MTFSPFSCVEFLCTYCITHPSIEKEKALGSWFDVCCCQVRILGYGGGCHIMSFLVLLSFFSPGAIILSQYIFFYLAIHKISHKDTRRESIYVPEQAETSKDDLSSQSSGQKSLKVYRSSAVTRKILFSIKLSRF